MSEVDIHADIERSHKPPDAFEAFDEAAAYVSVSLTRGRAITEARDVCCTLRDDYLRRELRAHRVFMRPIAGDEADELFCGEFDTGWAEVSHRPLNAAQRAALTPMWKVEPVDVTPDPEPTNTAP